MICKKVETELCVDVSPSKLLNTKMALTALFVQEHLKINDHDHEVFVCTLCLLRAAKMEMLMMMMMSVIIENGITNKLAICSTRQLTRSSTN